MERDKKQIEERKPHNPKLQDCDKCKYKKKATTPKLKVTTPSTKPTWKTSFMVFVYAFVVGLCLVIQAVLNLMPSFVENEIIKSNYWVNILNSDLEMPLEILSFLWVTMISAYIGIDRGLYAARSFTLSYGETDVGDPHTIRIVILVSGLLFLEAIACNAICRGDYALTEFASGFGMSCCLYVAGQKVIKAGKASDGKHDKEELHPEEMDEPESQDNTEDIPM